MKPYLKPYEMLSQIYDPKESSTKSPLLSYLDTLATKCHLSLDSILDLACGTGRLLYQRTDAGLCENKI
jgi:SAM-dependent methyltransferase